MEVEEERLTNLSYGVKDGNQITRMSWAEGERREREISIAVDSYSSWVLGTLRTRVPCRPHKGREMEVVLAEPPLCAGVMSGSYGPFYLTLAATL